MVWINGSLCHRAISGYIMGLTPFIAIKCVLSTYSLFGRFLTAVYALGIMIHMDPDDGTAQSWLQAVTQIAIHFPAQQLKFGNV